jgi:hypothetical protein
VLGVLLVGVADHGEKAVGHGLAIDDPGCVELLVTAVLGVDLGEHEKFDVSGIARNGTVGTISLREIFDLRLIQSQTEFLVCFLEGLFGRLGATLERDGLERLRGVLGEHQLELWLILANDLGHAVVEKIHVAGLVVFGAIAEAGDLHTTLDTLHRVAQAADV